MLLPQSFYARDTVTVARELLGTLLVHQTGDVTISGRIVETEAYWHDDPAAHSFRGETERNRIMFGPPGHAYVYFIYGMHWCINAVTGADGQRGEAVLIRALEPVEGIPQMIERRRLTKLRDLCSGPAKLCQALDITRASNGVPLFTGALHIRADDTFIPGEIVATTRIGIVKGAELPLRFYLKDNRYISRK